MQTVQTAHAKLVINRKLNTVRILVAYNVNKNSEGKYAFPSQTKCAYVSGDLLEGDIVPTAVRISQSLNVDLQFVA